MRKYCSGARKCAAVLALALTLGIQAGAAHAEESPGPIIDPVVPGDIVTLPPDPIDPGGTTEPGSGDPATTDPGTTDPAPSGSETGGPVTNLPGTTIPGGGSGGTGGTGGTVTNPVEPAPNPAPQSPAAPAPFPFIVEQPAGPVQDPAAGEIVPLPETPGPTSSSAAPALKPAAPAKTAAPVPIPEPVAKTLDSVVSVATGSPLYVQIITVLALLGAGFAYFRFMGSKSPRTPLRSHK